PVLTSVALRDPSPYINDGDNSHTNSELVYVDIVGDISAEGARPVSIQYYDYNPSGWKDWGSNFTGSTETITTTLASTNGTKTVYVQLIDEAGNYSGYINDTIILDTIAPAGTATINNGAAYTPSLSFKLNLNITDNLSQVTDFMVRSYDVYDEDGDGLVWEDYRTYSALMSSDMQFSITPGSKYTYTRIYDAAGNYVQIYDSITLQVPVAQYAWKGYYTSGASRIYYTPVTEDAGGNITRYYTYSTTNPNAAPNTNPADAAALTYEGYTTSTIYDYFTIPVGEIRYIFTRAYNVDTGGYGPYSATSVLAFGSNVTVVYDDDDSADIARANEIKALLEDDQNIVGHSSIYGTMPVWTVTLLPEDFISNTYGEANKIYGDPVILTPSVYFTTASTYDGKVRNIASMGRGIVAMGSSGGYFLYRVQYNWGVWGLTGTSPSYIDSGNQMTLTTAKTAKTRPASSSESIWYTPLYYSVLYPTYAEGSMGLNMFTTDEGRRGVSSSGAVPPPDGSIYAGDYSSTAHWPVVRQGRFLSFGYYDVPDVQVTGEVFFINLIARMDNF
ncbi:MAG: hypothetical protein KAJ19_25965, partial [Gammaproteobacteria bacterium]|nr:hypothetical protein [Gammaproteobacteria bacterium]